MVFPKQCAHYLEPIYRTATPVIEEELTNYLNSLRPVEPFSDDPHWYKAMQLYTIYPDGVIYNKKLSPLQNLRLHLNYIKKLGFNAIHILPFLTSPMIDAGFDISDFLSIRKNLGTLGELEKLIKTARDHQIQPFMDLVLNHVSERHSWFEQAQQGNATYRNYFIHTDKKPHFLRKFHRHAAVWAEYEVNGAIIAVNISFPEQVGEIPHWRQSKDGYWYYHTYYPQQLDLNWHNPEVFIHMSKIMLYWCSLGFNFRLDATPFIGKTTYKFTDIHNEATHLILAALRCLVNAINSQCAFLVESFESLPIVISYFGKTSQIQANLSYNFHLSTHLWVSLVTRRIDYLWQQLDKAKTIPEHAEWINFLRNHDELSLAHLDDHLTKAIYLHLVKYGKNFREGHGVSGRTYSLLGRNSKRHLMAYFLLASLPGALMLPYGDEIGCTNIAMRNLAARQRLDTRNINRGTFIANSFKQPGDKQLANEVAKLLAQRKKLSAYWHCWPKKLDAPACVYAALYEYSHKQLLALVNLSAKKVTINKALTNYQIIFQLNQCKIIGSDITLNAYAGIWIEIAVHW